MSKEITFPVEFERSCVGAEKLTTKIVIRWQMYSNYRLLKETIHAMDAIDDRRNYQPPGGRDSVLFTLESEHGFNFGDGQAQIFYKFYKDYLKRGAEFSFEWGCY